MILDRNACNSTGSFASATAFSTKSFRPFATSSGMSISRRMPLARRPRMKSPSNARIGSSHSIACNAVLKPEKPSVSSISADRRISPKKVARSRNGMMLTCESKSTPPRAKAERRRFSRIRSLLSYWLRKNTRRALMLFRKKALRCKPFAICTQTSSYWGVYLNGWPGQSSKG
jgi:hypothetical protein